MLTDGVQIIDIYRNVDLFSVFWREQGTNILFCSVHYDVCSGQTVLGACWGTEELGWKRGSRV